MQKQVPILGGVAILVALLGIGGACLVGQTRRQQATEERLAALQRQLAQRPAAAPAADAPAPAAIAPLPASSAAPQPMLVASGLPTLERLQNTQAVLDQGYRLLNRRTPADATRAAAVFQEGIDRVDRTCAPFYNSLGRSLLVAGHPREALAAWEKGLALDPKFHEMHSGMGWAYWTLHDPARAQSAWEAALTAAPGSIDAWSGLAWVYLARGQFDRAKQGFVILLTHDMNRKPWLYGLNMARARNRDAAQIARFFSLPPSWPEP